MVSRVGHPGVTTVRRLKIHGGRTRHPEEHLALRILRPIEANPQIPTKTDGEEKEKESALGHDLRSALERCHLIAMAPLCVEQHRSSPLPLRGHDTCQPPVSTGMSRHKCTLCGKVRQHAARVKGVSNSEKTKKNTSPTVANPTRSVDLAHADL